nr:immunoglobulin light chain junction region [Macaca mulatta]
CQQYSRTPFTF